jgi:hypothetical protein
MTASSSAGSKASICERLMEGNQSPNSLLMVAITRQMIVTGGINL